MHHEAVHIETDKETTKHNTHKYRDTAHVRNTAACIYRSISKVDSKR